MDKIALITPNWLESNSLFPADTQKPPKSFPIEWAYLYGALSSEKLHIVDAYGLDLSLEEVMNQIEYQSCRFALIATAPSYLFWRCPPLNIDVVCKYAKELKRRNIITILFGPHPTISPDWVMSRSESNYIFRGEIEGLLPVLESITSYSDTLTAEGLCSSNNIVEPAPEIDVLPYADYGAMTENYPTHSWIPEMQRSVIGVAGALVEASRGCSWDCDFCLRDGYRRFLRTKDITVLDKELDTLISKEIGYVFFIDETFGAPWKFYKQVLSLLASKKITFGIQTRPDIWSVPRISELSRAGCIYVELGIESVDNEALDALGKFSKSRKTLDAVEEFRRKIQYVGANSFDFSIPELDLCRGNKRLVSEGIKDDKGNAACAFIPYPGTPLGNEVIAVHGGMNSPWEKAAAIHALLSLENRYGLQRILRASGPLRKIVVTIIETMQRIVFFRIFNKSRYESQSDNKVK